MSYGIRVLNADGIPVIDSRYRSMEAVAWGTVAVPNRSTVQIDFPTGIAAPMLFLKPQSVGLMVRGKADMTNNRVFLGGDRNFNVDYVIGAFPTDDGVVYSGYGMNAWDEEGRLTFSTNKRYMRFPYRSITLLKTADSPSDFANYTMVSGGSPAYQHPAWGANTYLYWNPMFYWEKDTGADWHLGLWFGSFGGDTRRIEVKRVDFSKTHSSPPSWLGSIFTGPPGTNLAPSALLSCEFVPPP